MDRRVPGVRSLLQCVLRRRTNPLCNVTAAGREPLVSLLWLRYRTVVVSLGSRGFDAQAAVTSLSECDFTGSRMRPQHILSAFVFFKGSLRFEENILWR